MIIFVRFIVSHMENLTFEVLRYPDMLVIVQNKIVLFLGDSFHVSFCVCCYVF